jgi:hypothetical protein
VNFVTCMSVAIEEFGFVIGFIELLQIVNTNCSAIANSHTHSSLEHVVRLLVILCLHQSLSGNGFQRRT